MTVVPLPDVACMRVRCTGTDDIQNTWGVRFYLKYAGSAPTGSNCSTLASDISSAWASNLSSLLRSGSDLTEVDVLDIATASGFSGQATTTQAGSRTGGPLPASTAMNVEYGIQFRYRGGKPRGYYPFGTDTDLNDQSHWTTTFQALVQTGINDFFSAVTALSVGAVGALGHVDLSYYHGFTNVTNPSGRTRAVPTYRATALHRDVISYIPKLVISSQRRRINATTP
jgi:hypothetical protein